MSDSDLSKYISNEIARSFNKGQKTGVTLWAVLAALFFCMSKLLPLIAAHRGDLFWDYAFSIFIFLYPGIFFIITSTQIKLKIIETFDTKVYRSPTPPNIDTACIWTGVLLVVGYKAYPAIITNNLLFLFFLPLLAFWIVTILITLIFGLKKLTSKKTKTVQVLFAKTVPKSIYEQGLSPSGRLISLAIGCFLILASWKALEITPSKFYADCIEATFYLVASALLIDGLLLLKLLSDSSYVAALVEIEKNLALGQIDKKSAKNLLKEIHGFKLTEWSSATLSLLEAKAFDVIEKLNKIDSLASEIEKIDVNLKYERSGRIDTFLDELGEMLDKYHEVDTILQKHIHIKNNKKLLTDTESALLESAFVIGDEKRELIKQLQNTELPKLEALRPAV